MVVRKHGVFVVRVRFSAARICARLFVTGAHSKMVLRVHGMDEAGVRFPVGPLVSHGHVAELVYAYGSEPYLARVESSNLSVPTQ